MTTAVAANPFALMVDPAGPQPMTNTSQWRCASATWVISSLDMDCVFLASAITARTRRAARLGVRVLIASSAHGTVDANDLTGNVPSAL